MEQFLLVPASVYNYKTVKTPTITKQELPKDQGEQNSSYQIDSLIKEINKNLFAKTDSLVDKILSRPCIRISKSQTLLLVGVETGVSLSMFAQQLRRTNADALEIYFTLLTAGMPTTLVLNCESQFQSQRERKLGPFHIMIDRNCKNVHARDAACGFVRNLPKASNISLAKGRKFIHSKSSYRKFTLATRKVKSVKAFVRLKNLTYIEKIARDNNRIKFLLVNKDLFDWTVDAKGRQTKGSQETARAFSFDDEYKKGPTQEILGQQGTKTCYKL